MVRFRTAARSWESSGTRRSSVLWCCDDSEPANRVRTSVKMSRISSMTVSSTSVVRALESFSTNDFPKTVAKPSP